MKRAEHLRMILDYPRPLNCLDKLILSTDQERSNIYIYQSHVVTGENLIDIYTYENNIAYSSRARTLPQQIAEINKEEELIYNPRQTSRKWQKDNQTYYVNSRFRHVVSSSTHINTKFP